MSGMNYTSSIKYDDDYTKFMAARRAGIGGGTDDPFKGQIQFATGLGTPAQIETSSIVNKAFGKCESGVQELENVVPGFLKNTIAWQKAKANGDYSKIANLVLMYARSGNRDNKQLLEYKAKELKDNDSLIGSIRSHITKADYDAVSFNGAFSTGGELPANNPYTSKVMNAYNKINGSKIRYSFSDNEELSEFANKVGINLNDSSVSKGKDEAGNPTLVIDKNNTINYKALYNYYKSGYFNARGFFGFLGRKSQYTIVGVDDNGVPQKLSPMTYNVGRRSRFTGKIEKATVNVTPEQLISSIVYAADNAFNKSERKIGDLASNVVTTTTKHMELPGVLRARAEYPDDPKKADEQVDMAVNNIVGMNGSQYEIMTFDKETNTLSSANIKDRTEALENIKSYLLNDTGKNKYILGLRIIDGKIGYRIQIPKDWNKAKNVFVDGDIEPGEIVIFNPDDPDLQKMQRDSRFVATSKYDRLSRINGASHNTYDNNEIKFDNGRPYINRRPVSREEAISYLDKDDAYTQLKFKLMDNITSSGTLTREYANTLAQFIASYYGYPINSPANIEKAGDLINQMQNELR